MKLFKTKKSEKPIYTSNTCQVRFIWICGLTSLMWYVFFGKLRGLFGDLQYESLDAKLVFVCLWMLFLGFALAAIRQASFLFRDRPTYVELYPDRLEGRAKNYSGPGPKKQTFSIPLDEAAVRSYDSSCFAIFWKKNIFVCYGGICGGDIQQYIFKRYQKQKKNCSGRH